jgi:regulation of enolase protein 1 (concanavalin A-like superfamily)
VATSAARGLAAFALVLLACVMPGNVPADSPREEVLFQDAFQGKLGAGWSWLREDRNAWRVADRALEIRPAHGTVDKATNLLVRQAPDTSKQTTLAEVTVSNDPTQQYEQCGIVWYYNDRHFVKLVKEVVDGKSWIVMGRSHPERGALAGKIPFVREDKAVLRLDVAGETITGRARKSAEGKWTVVGTCPLPVDGPAMVSLQAYHGPTDAEHWARFENFRMLRIAD